MQTTYQITAVVSDIEWDADEDNICGLPKEIEVVILMNDPYYLADYVSDFLTDEFEFLHKGFSIDEKERTEIAGDAEFDVTDYTILSEYDD